MKSKSAAAGFIAGALCAAALGAGVAIASIPSTTTGQITACVNNSTHAVRIIDYQAGARCSSTERTVSWSKGYRYRGTWSATAAYAVLDVVTYSGSSYVAKAASTGRSPASSTTYWGLLAARGATGPTGPSNGYAGYRDGPVSLNGATGTSVGLGTLALGPGNYVIAAKLTVENTSVSAVPVSCQLLAVDDSFSDFDYGYAVLAPATGATLSMNVVHTFVVSGQAQVSCVAAPGVTAHWVKVSAIKVGSLSNAPLS